MKEYKDLLEGYEGENNIFPASYVVTLTDLSLSEDVESTIASMEGVKRITSSDKTMKTLVTLGNGINVITSIILVLLVLI